VGRFGPWYPFPSPAAAERDNLGSLVASRSSLEEAEHLEIGRAEAVVGSGGEDYGCLGAAAGVETLIEYHTSIAGTNLKAVVLAARSRARALAEADTDASHLVVPGLGASEGIAGSTSATGDTYLREVQIETTELAGLGSGGGAKVVR
jgi:hypothetical protein